MNSIGQAFRYLLGLGALLIVLWSFIHVGSRAFDDPAEGRDTTLTILFWGDPQEQAIVNATVEAFEAANPNVKVLQIGADYGGFDQKLKTMMAAGEPPDVFYLKPPHVRQLGERELVEPLGSYLERDPQPWFDQSSPVLIDTFEYDLETDRVGQGQLLGLPKDFSTAGFYINVDLFEAAGVPIPTDGWTWEEFEDAARKITALRETTGNDRIFGVHFNQWADVLAPLMWNFGGRAFEPLPDGSPDFTKLALGEPGAMEAMEMIRRMRFEEGTAFNTTGIGRNAASEFTSGNVGMIGPEGRWQTPTYRQSTNFDFDFVPIPTKPGVEPATGIYTTAWAMSSLSKHKPESWELIKFLAGREGQVMIGELGLAIPAMEDVANSDAFLTPELQPKNTPLFLELVPGGRAPPWPKQQEFVQLFDQAVSSSITLDEIEPAEVKTTIQKSWDRLLASPLQTKDYAQVNWLAIWIVVGILLATGVTLLWIKAKREKLGMLDAAQERAGFLFISPWLLGFVVLTAGPMVLSLILAFTRWSAMTPVSDAEFVGLDNFSVLITADDSFYQSLWVTLYYVVLAVPITQVAALAVALLMNNAIKGIEIFRTLYFLPSVITGVAMGTLWLALFNNDFGLINEVIRGVGLPAPDWFGKEAAWAAIPGFVIMSIWGVGGAMVIYLAGLKSVPPSLYESSTIDGAGPWRRFWNVTLPMLSPLVFFNLVMGIIGSFQVFTQAFVMTGRGPGDSTLFYVLNLYYQAFESHNMGYASAMAWILFILLLGLTILVFRASRSMVHYEGLKA